MFQDFKLASDIIDAIQKAGFEKPTEIQSVAIPKILEGKDIVGRSQTGSGKTLAFGIPALNIIDREAKSQQVLVISPTRELACQICDEIKLISKNLDIPVAPIYGGTSFERQIKLIRRAYIIVGTPGRLLDHLNRRTLRLKNIKMVVLDEADEMLNMGFRPDLEKILSEIETSHQTLMFSATMPTAIKTLTKQYLKNPEYIEVGLENVGIKEIKQEYMKCNKETKIETLISLLQNIKPHQTMIFCNTKKMVDIVNKALTDAKFNSFALHGDMRQSERKRVMAEFKTITTNSKILIATDVAGRGIDVKNVDLVINYDIPLQLENYIHRIGRTGRAGKFGKSITLVNTSNQVAQINKIAIDTQSTITELDNPNFVLPKRKSSSKVSDKRTTKSSYNSNKKRPYTTQKSIKKSPNKTKGEEYQNNRQKFTKKEGNNFKKEGNSFNKKERNSSFKKDKKGMFSKFNSKKSAKSTIKNKDTKTKKWN